jgi:hypothetical protein
MSDTFVGVDVATGEFVVAGRPDGVRWTATNDAEGIAATVIRAFYRRLLAAGQPKTLALTARLRTLLTILNTTMCTNTTWPQRSQPAHP